MFKVTASLHCIARRHIVVAALLALPVAAHAAAVPFVEYKFEDSTNLGKNTGSGGSAYDGIITGTPTASAGGISGNGLNLTSATSTAAAQYITAPVSNTGTSPSIGSSYTVSAWFDEITATAAYANPSRAYVYEGSDDYRVSFASGSAPAQNATTASYNTYINDNFAYTTDALTTNAFHNVTQTFSSDGTNTTVLTYIDGTLKNTYVVTGVATVAITDTPTAAGAGLRFGAARTTNVRYFNGTLDNLAIFNSALSGSDVVAYTGVPEPTTLAFLGSFGLVALRRKRHA